MKLIACLLIFAFSPCLSFSQKEIETDDFSLQVPGGWMSLSDLYLSLLEKKHASSFEKEHVKVPRTYVIGYSENDALGTEPPFFVGLFTEFDNYSKVPFDTIVAINCRAWEKINIDVEPIRDESNSRFYIECELENKYVFVGYVPGGTGLLQLSFYAEPEKVAERKEQFLTIYNSVQFFIPYVKDRSVERAEKEMKKSGGFLAIALLLGGVVFVTRYFIKKSSSNATEDEIN